VTTSTVRSHMRSIHGKLEAHSHVHALVVAVRQGIVTIA
jgi:DNA-binding CsgD family transcriptional regulator